MLPEFPLDLVALWWSLRAMIGPKAHILGLEDDLQMDTEEICARSFVRYFVQNSVPKLHVGLILRAGL